MMSYSLYEIGVFFLEMGIKERFILTPPPTYSNPMSVEPLSYDVTSREATLFTSQLIGLVKTGRAAERQGGFLALALYIVISLMLLLERGNAGPENYLQ